MSTLEAKLLKLKVVELKQILTRASLPQSGIKHELVARILGNKEALFAAGLENPSAAADVVASSGLVECDATSPVIGQPIPIQSQPPSTTVASQSSARESEPSQPNTPSRLATNISASASASAVDTVADEEKRRKARAARFGFPIIEAKKSPAQDVKALIPTPATTPTNGISSATHKVAPMPATIKTLADDEEKMKKRAARFGIPFVADVIGGANSEPTKPESSTPPTTMTTTQPAQKSVAKATSPLDPVEEEKKRKRGERFAMGADGPTGKKAKADV